MAVRTVKAGGKRRYAVEFEIRGHRIFRRLPPRATKGQADELEVVSAILGHKDLETTRKIYAHVLPETVRRAMDKGFKAHRPAHRAKRRDSVSA